MTDALRAALLWLVVLLLLGSNSYAADGDACPSTVARLGRNATCFILCDSKTSSDTECDEYFLDTKRERKQIVIELFNDTLCSDGFVQLFVASAAGLAVTDQTQLAALGLAGSAPQRIVNVDAEHAMPLQYLKPRLLTPTDCTDIDVFIHLR